MNANLMTRLDLLQATIPDPTRRRTARGLLRTCRELGDHIARARQLDEFANTEAERDAIHQLITELERRRAELADGGNLAERVRGERAEKQDAKRSLWQGV